MVLGSSTLLLTIASTSSFCAAQVDIPLFDFLRPALVPVIQTDVATGSTGNIHLALVRVAAVGATPNQLAMLILDNLNLLVPTTALAVVSVIASDKM